MERDHRVAAPKMTLGIGKVVQVIGVSLFGAALMGGGDRSRAQEGANVRLAVEIKELVAVCPGACRQMAVRLEVKNTGQQTLCIPSNTTRATLSSYTGFFGPGGTLPRTLPYRGGLPRPFVGTAVPGRDFTFPVYVLNPGRTVELYDSETDFLHLEKGEPVEATVSVLFFACGQDAPESSIVMQSSARQRVTYETVVP